jgi:hypothetical protein
MHTLVSLRRRLAFATDTPGGGGGRTDVVATLDATDPSTAGDDDDQHDDGDDQGDDDAEEEPDGAAELGDKGKQALDRMKERLRAERTKRQAAERALADKDGAEAAKQAEAAAVAKANQRIVRAEVRAAAAGRLSDPADALSFLDLEQFEVDDDGQVDADEIGDAITDLLNRKPYLAAQRGPRSPQPDPAQGGTGRGPASAAERFAAQLGTF